MQFVVDLVMACFRRANTAPFALGLPCFVNIILMSLKV